MELLLFSIIHLLNLRTFNCKYKNKETFFYCQRNFISDIQIFYRYRILFLIKLETFDRGTRTQQKLWYLQDHEKYIKVTMIKANAQNVAMPAFDAHT